MIDKNQVLEVVSAKGYVVPSDLVRQFHVDTFIMGAVLSDLVHDKKLAVSTVKIGGSPVYYPPEQKQKLVELSKYLNEKDKQTFVVLQEKKVLLDEQQTPLLRVSLRNIKDYAKPLEVTANGATHLFWKWYLATEEEVHGYIKNILIALHAVPVVEHSLGVSVSQGIPQSVPEPVLASSTKSHIQKHQKQVLPLPTVLPPQQQLLPKQLPLDDVFAQAVSLFFQKKGMQLADVTIIKKGELDCLIEIPSPVGSIMYFCKAKNKKKCSEGEIATTFVAAQGRKLPAMLLIPGEISKKVQQKLAVDYPNMKVLQL